MKLLKKGRRIGGSILLFIGVCGFLGYWFNIDTGKVVGFTLSAAFIYMGYRMIRSKNKEIEVPPLPAREEEPVFHSPETAFHTYSMGSPQNKHSLIGNLFLTGGRWDLHDMNIWHGIGDVKIDLSRAHINEGETIIIINGWIGDIDIYVPYDLDISLTASVNFGDIDVFGNKQGGINRSMTLSTSGYRESGKRVRIVVSLLIGDIDVIYL
nr:cell wall-active antibiotics response protein LiaF [Aneurinibacillus tyrosinisolvens]